MKIIAEITIAFVKETLETFEIAIATKMYDQMEKKSNMEIIM